MTFTTFCFNFSEVYFILQDVSQKWTFVWVVYLTINMFNTNNPYIQCLTIDVAKNNGCKPVLKKCLKTNI